MRRFRGSLKKAKRMDENSDFSMLKEYIKSKGLDIGFYRDPYLKRRLNLRMNRNKAYCYKDYLIFLKEHPEEYQEFVDCLAVNVTSFFRDEAPYQILGRKILPEIAERINKNGNTRLSIWSSACSTGEEPYSIAITAYESIHIKLADGLKLSIHATDIDIQALEQAKKGEYTEKSIAEMDDKRKRRYFKFTGRKYSIKESIRKLVRFKQIDLIRDKAIYGVDIVFCRNMLIYIAMELQEKIIEKFYHALNPGGYLFLGRTEILPDAFQKLFTTVDSKERVYQKGG